MARSDVTNDVTDAVFARQLADNFACLKVDDADNFVATDSGKEVTVGLELDLIDRTLHVDRRLHGTSVEIVKLSASRECKTSQLQTVKRTTS